ncbi:MAG: peptide chain release factor N(5)-glutamine methyltransferase [Bacteroidota bacterium]
MLFKDLRKDFDSKLEGIYDKRELQAIERQVFQHVLGYSPAELSLHLEDNINSAQVNAVRDIISELQSKRPLQYIIGETEFHGFLVKVDPRVLIPRPETEELVAWILEDEPGETILDIGTGSGCIAIALSRKIRSSHVFATDFMQDAVDVATENAKLNQTEVKFILHDILNYNGNPFPVNYDIIVSNPPYVTESEKELMDDNVLKYEPESALFVPDDDPLKYYKAITEFANEYLTDDGKLFFEINEEMADRMERMLNKRGFDDVKFRRDINRKTRMVRAQRS